MKYMVVVNLTILLIISCKSPTTSIQQKVAKEPVKIEEENRSQAEIVRWFIGPIKKPCQGLVPSMCLQISTHKEGPYGNYYGSIVGFTHETGFLFEVEIKKEKKSKTLADSSAFKFTLVKILSKTKV
ncbi:MAG: DUF4377 domain-containing protein [Flavobacteriaceae bacterium]|nr:DUF4377 domain-containing protein [Flavobacteriaceae bacterium]